MAHMGHITKEMQDNVERQWVARAANAGLKAGTKKYRELEVEFFVGAMAGLVAAGFEKPVWWTVAIMSGRSCVVPKADEVAA